MSDFIIQETTVLQSMTTHDIYETKYQKSYYESCVEAYSLLFGLAAIYFSVLPQFILQLKMKTTETIER